MGTKAEPYREDMPTPDLYELLQRPEGALIGVEVAEPVLTHELPCKVGAVRRYTLGTTFDNVASAGRKRKLITIIGDNPFVYSNTGYSGSGIQWPAALPLVLRNIDPVYIASTGGNVTVGIIEEVWAD